MFLWRLCEFVKKGVLTYASTINIPEGVNVRFRTEEDNVKRGKVFRKLILIVQYDQLSTINTKSPSFALKNANAENILLTYKVSVSSSL